MKAMVIRRYGEPDVFELAELEPPTPRPGQVLVKVHGSSVNPLDAGIRRGMLQSFHPLALPAVLGVDVSGVVVALGDDVRHVAVGDRVFAYTGVGAGGGYGQLAVLPERTLARVPDELDLVAAGTVPGVGATAYEALTVHAPLAPGMRLFVNGAAGGVGVYAIQIARARGAEVHGTCSPAKADLVRRLGATPIDYTRGDPFGEHGAYDVVLDAVRGADEAPLRKLLRPGGTLLSIVSSSRTPAGDPGDGAPTRRIAFFVDPSASCLEGLAAMIAAGEVSPVIERIYPVTELADAHRRVETGRVAGKVGIDVHVLEGA